MITYSELHSLPSSNGFLWYMFSMLVSSAAVIITIAHPSASLIFFLFLIIFVLIYSKPIIGIYLLTILYPIDSIFLSLNLRWPEYIRIYWVEILSIILLMVMILRYLVKYHSIDSNSLVAKTQSDRCVFLFFAAFVVWSTFTVFWSAYLDRALFGWFRFNCLFITMSFLVIYLDSYDKFVRLMTFYCCVAALFAFMAIYATYYAFLINYILLVTPNVSLSAQISLFNQTGGIFTPIVGMVVGYGLSSKHELAMFLLCGVGFALFLIKHYKSTWIKSVLVFLILLFETVIYQIFVKLSIISSFFVLVFICMVVSSWRKSIIVILACFVCLNVIALSCSQILRPFHMKNTESTVRKIKKASAESEYQSGSFSLRMRYWKRAIERIRESNGMGNGPDSLWRDVSCSPHAHNIVLTMAAEYGIPSVIFILGALFFIAKETYYQVFTRSKVNDNRWLLKIVLVATTLCALFEYFFDVFIWWQQLWYMLGLLLASLRLGPLKSS